jgi:hypothetical protein
MVPFLDNTSNAEKKKKGGGAEAGAVGGVEGQAFVKLAGVLCVTERLFFVTKFWFTRRSCGGGLLKPVGDE